MECLIEMLLHIYIYIYSKLSILWLFNSHAYNNNGEHWIFSLIALERVRRFDFAHSRGHFQYLYIWKINFITNETKTRRTKHIPWYDHIVGHIVGHHSSNVTVVRAFARAPHLPQKWIWGLMYRFGQFIMFVKRSI